MKVKEGFTIVFGIIILLMSVSQIALAEFKDINIRFAGEDYLHQKNSITDGKVIEDMFVNALGGAEAYDEIPNLELKNKKSRSIVPEMMIGSIVKGIDETGRPFIAYKQENKKTGKQGVEVFYQRYSNNPYLWINGGDYALKYLFPVNRGIVTKESVEQFANMIRNENFVSVYNKRDDNDKCFVAEKNIKVSDEVVDKITQVIEADLRGELLSGVRFLENDDSRSFVLENVAPGLIFKYYLRDTSMGYYIKSWHENACVARNICELYDLDRIIIPETKIIEINIEGKGYFIMVKENVLYQNILKDYVLQDFQSLSNQVLTFMFKTGIGCIGPSSLLLLSNGFHVAVTFFEEFNYDVVNYNIVSQLFSIRYFRENKGVIEKVLDKFIYFNRNGF